MVGPSLSLLSGGMSWWGEGLGQRSGGGEGLLEGVNWTDLTQPLEQRRGIMDGAGALPFGNYEIEEMRCEKNKGFKLQKFTFTVNRK